MPRMTLPIKRKGTEKCADQHFGPWAIETKRFREMVAAVNSGKLQPRADWSDALAADDDEPTYEMHGDVAVISISGQMTKRGSSFGGCSTVQVRQAVRDAAADAMVKAIVMHICSPGGTVAGTSDLADDVRAAGKAKPVDAYIEDMGCSAAYWIACQCRTITANVTAVVGSIGTYAVLEDDTGLQEQIGVQLRVVSTGDYKGLGADGAVSDKLIADVQREVNELNGPFQAAVLEGRGDRLPDIVKVSDGRVHVGQQAKDLGLIDAIGSLDSVVGRSQTEVNQMALNDTDVKAYLREHPSAAAELVDAAKAEAARTATATAQADATKAERERLKAVATAAGDNHQLAVDAMLGGLTAEATAVAKSTADRAAAKSTPDAAALAAANAELAKLRGQMAFKNDDQQPPAAATGAAAVAPPPTAAQIAADAAASASKPTDWPGVAAKAAADWKVNHDGCQQSYVDEANYASYLGVVYGIKRPAKGA